ncbi:hypothetical protein CONCODRAFT_69181 [Conidiobolus coronatus NRRL 28638]|uniref:Transmembrane protein 198 n=1 Tax=Conidiobolus coronatus (strain ATCC 28846 / CBS 209.66 / NRRL 28638) TaxID=796925 RepID=A0A137PBC3_CONC2|nr:hypothetical protein CONCODRAFT_69181 [Conidiobolus coronatus NRRL 28638]|eukprot:KXN72309.1 hypothetical protein CONCODRAFT_69181 [Conidiobolus coronatus NRRL 28638]
MIKYHTIKVILLITLLNYVIAQNSSSSPSNNDNNKAVDQTQDNKKWSEDTNSPVKTVVGIIAILFGITFLSIGRYIEKFMKSMSGFLALGFLVIEISSFAVNLQAINTSQYIGILSASIIIGIIGGILAWYYERFGKITFGLLFGISIGQLITRISFVKDINILLCIIIGFGVLGALISIFPIKYYILVGTNFIGAQLLMCGIDLLTNLGYLQFFKKEISQRTAFPSPVVWGMMALVIIITVIGIFFQIYVLPDKTKSTPSSSLSLV